VGDETPAPGEPGIGELLAGYRLDEIIGRGGMAVVYRAYDERLGRTVALKVLAPRLAQDEAFRQRFIRESRIAAAVDHPNIIPIFEAGEADGFLFIAMRFVHGRDVLTVIEEQGPLAAARACHMVTQAAAALDAAHARGLVHRDVKPANMLREAAGEDQPEHVYLSDFGLSKRWVSSSTLTSQGEFLGTMDYVAPEQIEGKPVDGRADQYALASSAFEMLTGAPPFRREDTMAIMWAQVSATPPSLTSRRPGLPVASDPVMAKALAKAPGDRYRSCLEFAAALRSACGAGPSGTGPAAAGPAAPARSATQAVSGEDLAAAAARAQASEPPASEAPVSEPSVSEPPASEGPVGEVPPARLSASQPPAAEAPPPEPPSAPEELVRQDTELIGMAAATRPAQAGGPTRSRRSRGVIIAACVALLAVIGGGYALFGRGSGAGAALAVPGCNTKTAASDTVRKVHGHLVTTGLKPFDAVVTSHGYGFVTLTSALAVMRTTGPAPALVRTIPVAQALGVALTHDQKYLLVSGQSGLEVFSVSDLEQGLSSPVGTLTSPGGGHAVQVAISPDGHYAFVTLQSGGRVAVFNLRRALTSGFGPADLVGLIRVPAQPIGITTSPDGRYVYVASGLATPASASHQGSLTVIDLRTAEKSPSTSVVKVVNAGCGPDRVAVSNDNVWVTVGGGNALVAFSAAKLLTDPQHAEIARVAVGELPLGLTIYDHGARIVVADSNRDHVPGGVSNLAVIDVQKALDHQPALLGTVRSGDVPRQVALYPGGKTLLVTDTGSGQVQAIKVADLP
jgi:DNA-binding beta-propeller fold protein YncE/tRNA A-37 threonylcarbamoyl transferase component Bud32